MKVTVAGTGYVGLVTGVCLAEIGHYVTCIDVNKEKIEMLTKGRSPIYEPGLEEMLNKNKKALRLRFTTNSEDAYSNSDIIIIAVGTPENDDGSANLSYIYSVTSEIAKYMKNNVLIAVKSTVPVGTNDFIREKLLRDKRREISFDIVSNPEFLREGSAISDTFQGDRIVIGANSSYAFNIMEELYSKLNLPIVKTDIKSAEMIKYASNAFLATKISFINEIANICEKVGANVEDVSNGIGMDKRIGHHFLKAGIGYGGSCFPKDTKALVQLAGNVEHNFELLESVIKVNNEQPLRLIGKALMEFGGDLAGKKVALLGLTFKPNTDDIRESASIVLAKELVNQGASVTVYDPVAIKHSKRVLRDTVKYCNTIDCAIEGTELVFIGTEWNEIITYPPSRYKELMKNARVYDGRNCYKLEDMKKWNIDYVSIGRKHYTSINN